MDQHESGCLLLLCDGYHSLKPVVVEKPREIKADCGKWDCVTVN